jgi:branched-chain amino acid transport system substrate-binding protein
METSVKSNRTFVQGQQASKRRGILCRAITALGLALGLQSAVAAPDSIRIGLLTIDSGSFAFMQPYFLDAARLAVDSFNAEGGILGRKVELVVSSHAGTPASALAAATRMVQNEKVTLLTGFLSTPMASVLGPRMESLGAILLDSSTVSDDAITKTCQSHYFHLYTPDSQRMKALERLIRESGVKSWNMIGADYSMGHNARKQFEGTIKEGGGQLKTVVFQPLGTTDFGSQISQLATSAAEGLVVAVPGSDALIFAKQQRQFGLFKRYKTVVALGFTDDVGMPGQGDTTVGTYMAQGWHYELAGERVARFVQQYRERYKRNPTYMDAEAFSAYELLRLSIQRAGGADVRKVRDALATIRGTTVLGDVYMRADHQLMRPLVVGRIESAGPGLGRVALIRQETPESTAPPQLLTCN